VNDGVDATSTLESSALMSEMRDRVAFLEEELRRKDAILLNMTEAMKAQPTTGHELARDPRIAPDGFGGAFRYPGTPGRGAALLVA
jgi:hypothetical protein